MTITQASLSIDNLDKLDQDVDAASAQAVNILQSFSTIGNKLQAIDALNLQSMKFTPQWSTFGNRYRAILRNSSSLASNIADLALAFNSEVLDLVNNTSIPADEKVNILNDFVTDSTILRNVSNSVAVAFEELSQDILTFRGNFDNFAAPRLNNDTAAIQTLMQDIANLQQQVANMETAIEALGVTLAATLLGSAAAMAIFPLFAPAVLVAAGIAEGAILASQAGLAAAIAADQSDISTKQGQLQTLKDQVNTIDSTQYSLDTLSIGDLPTVASHVTFFTAVWEDVSDECTKLIGWLEDGADNAVCYLIGRPAAY
ncbi:hypothetical protein BC834DRAFT_303656 [Gloeopeniophorella convolvens]|nr:hypothetical protein BC834DRAFT_303656 [Gloeopeniophorella convolvens]